MLLRPQNPIFFSNLSGKTLTLNLQKNPFLRIAYSSRTSPSDTSPSVSSHCGINRISRIAQSEAQNALLDYLNSTRSLLFTDAEHMSKNSPNFLQKLMSKVENEQDIGRSITRFLRYHPINEFEPFFESLGLKPSEFCPLLPRDLLFLSDDHLLLDNFHVLCNYGFPRSKIGKMYKEEREIFRHGDGVLLSKLRAYEVLGLSRPALIKLVNSCPSLLVGSVNENFVGVLEKLKSLDIEKDWIVGVFSQKNSCNWSRILGLFIFLEKMGFGNREMADIIKMHPKLFFEGSGQKMCFLVSLLMKVVGLQIDEIKGLILQYPSVLAPNITRNFCQGICLLRTVELEIEEIARLVRSYPHILGLCSFKRSELVFRRSKVGKMRLRSMILEDPNLLRNWVVGNKISRVPVTGKDEKSSREKTKFLLKLGYVENSDEMTKALKKFRGKGDELQERFDSLVEAGLDVHDVSNMIKLSPAVLNQCREVLVKKMDFLVNDFGYPRQSLVKFPSYLCYDMERVKVRFLMYKWLKEKGVARPNLALGTILACSDERFLKQFVNLHPEGLAVWEKLNKSSSSG
ncbi:hypothetical protein AMTR_s00029p00164640 [Amborella trichopoda]|uniref:Uncharacterized protein n=2 Tax=Amborella trichopoda TaxID=13333 RepID=W1PPC8_AMBTC|nr:hypothetical protein AMTR_s00029p00164640 [Amborella trichopoda]